MEQNDVLRERGHTARLPVVPPQCPRRLRERADRDRPRAARAELRARVGVCDRLPCSGRGGGDDQPRRRRRRACRGHGVLHASGHPCGLLRDARARGRGGGSRARLAPVRRDASRVRHGRGCLRPAAGGLERAVARGARIYAEVLGYGTSNDAHHMAQPDPDSVGVAEMMRAALSRAGVEPERVGYINAHGTSTPQGDLAETKAIKAVFGTTHTSSPSRRRSPSSATSSGPPERSRR